MSNYTPDTIEEIATVEEYCLAVESVLKFWLDTHTKPEAWAHNWLLDGDPQETLRAAPKISNDYFTFDLLAASLEFWARDNAQWFIRCRSCGCISDKGWGDCCDKVSPAPVSAAALAEWMSDIGPDGAQVTDRNIIDALEKRGFRVYRAAIRDVVRSCESEVREVLKSIRAAKRKGNRADLLQTVMWGTRVFHVNGNIMDDYAHHIDQTGKFDQMVNAIRNGGLESIFSSEDVKEFLEGA